MMITTADQLHEKYTDQVDNGIYPDDPKVPLPTAFVNEVGEIQNILLKPCSSVTVLKSRKGKTRANHYHKEDWHYAYVTKGAVLYFERAIGSTEIPEPRLFLPGEMFFTPPLREHCMLFAEESEIITMAKRVRNHAEHEADVVRVSFITPEIASRFVK